LGFEEPNYNENGVFNYETSCRQKPQSTLVWYNARYVQCLACIRSRSLASVLIWYLLISAGVTTLLLEGCVRNSVLARNRSRGKLFAGAGVFRSTFYYKSESEVPSRITIIQPRFNLFRQNILLYRCFASVFTSTTWASKPSYPFFRT